MGPWFFTSITCAPTCRRGKEARKQVSSRERKAGCGKLSRQQCLRRRRTSGRTFSSMTAAAMQSLKKSVGRGMGGACAAALAHTCRRGCRRGCSQGCFAALARPLPRERQLNAPAPARHSRRVASAHFSAGSAWLTSTVSSALNVTCARVMIPCAVASGVCWCRWIPSTSSLLNSGGANLGPQGQAGQIRKVNGQRAAWQASRRTAPQRQEPQRAFSPGSCASRLVLVASTFWFRG